MDTEKAAIPKLIGLYSPAPQSGKTTLALFMEEHLGFERRSFSFPIKIMVETFLRSAGLDRSLIDKLSLRFKESAITPIGGASYRELCQTLGTNWGRDLIHKQLWIDILMQSLSKTKPTVIDDVRFPNEADTIHSLGGEIWHINRPNRPLLNGHLSEGLLGNTAFDRVLWNAGTQQELFQQLIFPERSIN